MTLLLNANADPLWQAENGETPLEILMKPKCRTLHSKDFNDRRSVLNHLLPRLPDHSLTSSSWSCLLFREVFTANVNMLPVLLSKTGGEHTNTDGIGPLEALIGNLFF